MQTFHWTLHTLQLNDYCLREAAKNSYSLNGQQLRGGGGERPGHLGKETFLLIAVRPYWPCQ